MDDEDLRMRVWRAAAERGHTRGDGIDSRHAFSAGDYHDAAWTGWGALRVVNEVVLQPGARFAAQRRANMEILTYVIDGALRYRDRDGVLHQVDAGGLQWVGAGHGIDVDEGNASDTAPLRVLQAWIQPDRVNAVAARAQLAMDHASLLGEWRTLASPDAIDGGAPLRQQAWVRVVSLAAGVRVVLPVDASRRYWLQVLCGALTVADRPLAAGDALGIVDDTAELAIAGIGDTAADLVVFDLPL